MKAAASYTITEITDGLTPFYQYARNSSNSIAPTSGWSVNMPASESGKFIWRREGYGLAYTDVTAWGNAMCLTGATGAKGSKGDAGNSGSAAKDFSILASPATFQLSSRGMTLDQQAISLTCSLLNINSSQVSVGWEIVGTADVSPITGIETTASIAKETMIDSFQVKCSVSGFGNKILKIMGVRSGSAKPMYLGIQTSAPGQSSEGPLFGSPVDGGDFYLDTGNIPHWYNGTSWNPVDEATPNYSQIMAAVLGDVFNSNTTVPVSSAVYGFFKSLAANDAFLKYLRSLNVLVGNGNGMDGSGFRFRSRSYDSAGTYDPLFDIFDGSKQLFKVDVPSGKIYFGQYFWYDPADGALHTPDDTTVITSGGKIKSIDGEFIGTLKTGPNAKSDARVAIRDQSGILSNVFSGSGDDSLRFVTQGEVAGTFKVRIASLFSQHSYTVGDTGPAGGVIFYKNGTLYLEAAPATSDHTSQLKYSFNNYTNPVDLALDRTTPGTKPNTDALLTHSGFYAAEWCRNTFSMGGYTDWCLPSIDALALMRSLFGASFFSRWSFSYPWYMSSTGYGTTYKNFVWDIDNNSIWSQQFINVAWVKPVRQFTPPITYPTFQWSSDGGSTWSSPIAFNDTDSYALGSTGISIAFSSMQNHTVGDTWTFNQGAMRGLSVIDSAGKEYLSASNGTVAVDGKLKVNGEFRLNEKPAYPCRAWVNFNGQGTVSVRGSANVSSVSDLGTGSYRVNFEEPMPDASYAFAGQAAGQSQGIIVWANNAPTLSAASCTIRCADANSPGTLRDPPYVLVAFFR